jgi:hypothetical protein
MANQGRFVAPLLSLVIAAPVMAQAPQPVAPSWAGWAQCQISIQAPGYTHRETHLWTMTGAGTPNANMEIYPTSWTVTGDGSLQRVNGPTMVSAQWTVNGTLPNVTIGTTRHLDRITVQRWTNHGPARSGLTGTEITTINGVARSRPVVLDVQQWAFPPIATGTASTRATGSNSLPFDGLRGPLNPPSGAMGTAACTWDFARGGASPSAPPPSTVTAPTTSSSGTAPTTPSSGTPSGTTVSAGAPAGGGAPAGSVSGGGTSAGTASPGGATADLYAALSPGPIDWTSQPTNARMSLVIAFGNRGPSAVNGAVIRVPASAGVSKTSVRCSINNSTPCLANLEVPVAQAESGFTLPSLPAGSFGAVFVDATVTAASGTMASVPLTLTPPGDTRDPNPGDNSYTKTFTVVASTSGGAGTTGGTGAGAAADLTIDYLWPLLGLGNVVSWPANGISEYELGVYNRGPSAADGATITVPASSGLTKTSVSCGLQSSSQSVVPTVAQIESGLVIPTLPANDLFRCRIEATVTGPAGGSVTMAVNVTPPSGVSDPSPGNNTRTHTLPITSGNILPTQMLPAITTVMPASAPPGARALAVSITAAGTHFVQGVSYIDFGELLGATSLTITSPTTATAIINVDPAAPLGPRNITMTTPSPDGTTEIVSRAAAFTVGGVASPGPMSPPSGTSPSSGTTPASGRYRVTATSVYFRNAEADNPGPAIGDGKGDEIYLTSYAQVYDRRNGNQLAAGPLLRTPVHGDMSGAGGGTRVRAGSATPNGGIATGDDVQLQMPGTSPVSLWEGELRDGIDVVVLRPVLWEFDGNEAAWYTVYAQRFPPAAPRQAFDLPVVQAAIPRAGVAFESVPGSTMTGAWVADTQDHPIGTVLNLTGTGQVAGTWTDRVLTLTREKLEPWLTAAGGVGRLELRVWGEIRVPAPGVGTVQQNVRQDAVADYTLNVTIERRP